MKLFLKIVAVAFALFGVFVFSASESAIHEILSVLLIGFSALMLGAVGTISAVESAADKLADRINALK